MKPTILIVDDHASLRETFVSALQGTYHVRQAATVAEAKAQLADGEVDLALLDLNLHPRSHDHGGFEILQWIRRELVRPVGVILCTVEKKIEVVVEAMKLGADDYLAKDCENEELIFKVRNALEKVSLQRERFVAEHHDENEPDLIIGESPEIKKILKQVERLADKDDAVLILGEAGTGKELIARRLHELSWRKKSRHPFIALNCGAIAPGLAESTLFGHERGAFTGANQRQLGKMEVAAQGTLFLDEVDCLPLDQQTRFLRALEVKTFERLGSSQPLRLRARVVAAAKNDLPEAVAAGKFRQDLFSRLNVINLTLPPLRQRAEDIRRLAKYFCDRFGRKNGLEIEAIDEAVMATLQAYRWPGNVRDLRNEFERILALTEPGTRVITREMLSAEILQAVGIVPSRLLRQENKMLTLRQARVFLEQQLVDEALQKTGKNITRAAKLLGVTRRGLQKIMERHDRAFDADAE